MSPTVSFVLGLLAGWLGEWIIDWVYWRRRPPAALDTAPDQARLGALQAELAASRKENQLLREKISQLEAEKSALAAQPAPAVPLQEPVRSQPAIPEPPTPDHLEDIKGIGPVIARKLNELGIFTFEDLAATTPEFLRANLGDAIQRLANEDALIEQARQFAERKHAAGTNPA